MTTLRSRQDEFRGRLVEAGLLIETGNEGLYACGAEFERILEYELDLPGDPPESGDSDEEEPDGSQPGSS